MPVWISDHTTLLGWLALLSGVTFVGSLVAIPWLVTRIPRTYFVRRRPVRLVWWGRHPLLRWAMRVLKNVAGWVFIVTGVAMLVLPGQGIMTMVAGVLLIDFPGKYRFERWLAGRPAVMRALNWMRRRAGRPPLEPPAPDNHAAG